MRKRILIVVALLATATGMQAQYGDLYYHRVGDTIEWRSEIGYYGWWMLEYYYENNLPLYRYQCDATHYYIGKPIGHAYRDSIVVVQRLYTPTPLRVVGLAGTCTFFQELSGLNEPTEYRNYFVIYDAEGDSFPLVGKLEWNPFDPHRTLHVILHYPCALPGDSTCCLYNPQGIYMPLYEYYFDSAIIVKDSFYVGGTYFGGDFSVTGARPGYWCVGAGGADINVPQCQAALSTFGRCCIDSWPHKAKYGIYVDSSYGSAYSLKRSFAEAPWEQLPDNQMYRFLIYPIIQVDTTVLPISICDPVANVQVTTSGTTATVTWDGFPYYSRIFLRYGRRSLPQTQWTEIDVTGSTMHTLTDLDPRMLYGVTLKAECDTSKQETPWSATAYFFTGVDTTVNDTTGGGGVGIGGETALSRLIFLQPNPAQDEIRVESSFSLRTIEIWTLDGVLVYHGGAVGHETTVDVSYLRAGTYIVAIHTYNGTTHKKLLITR